MTPLAEPDSPLTPKKLTRLTPFTTDPSRGYRALGTICLTYLTNRRVVVVETETVELPALDEELAKQGVDVSDLGDDDRNYLAQSIRALVARVKSRASWESRVGPLLNHSQVLDVTGWTKQALGQAVREHRVLRLDSDGNSAYLLAGFDDQSPARPLRGVKRVFAAWAVLDPRGWTAASWLMSPQPELGGHTPREALLAGRGDEVAVLAEQAAARLAE